MTDEVTFEQLGLTPSAGTTQEQPAPSRRIDSVSVDDLNKALTNTDLRSPEQRQMEYSVAKGAEQDPAKAQRILQIKSKMPGFSEDFIGRNFDELDKEAKRADFNGDKFFDESPVVSRWLAENPDRAAAIAGDYSNVSAVEGFLRKIGDWATGFDQKPTQDTWGSGFKKAISFSETSATGVAALQKGAGALATGAAIRNAPVEWLDVTARQLNRAIAGSGLEIPRLYYSLFPGSTAKVQYSPEATKAIEADPWFKKAKDINEYSAETLKDLQINVDPWSPINATQFVPSAVDNLATMVLTGTLMPGATVVQKSVAAMTLFSSQVYLQTLSDKLGEGMTFADAQRYSNFSVLNEGIPEVLPFAAAFSPAKPLRRMLWTGAVEGFEEILSEIGNIWYEESEQGKTVTVDQMLHRIAWSFIGGFTIGGAMGGGGVLMERAQMRAEAKRTSNFFKSLGETTGQSTSFKSLPDAMQELVVQMKQANGGAINDVYIPIRSWEAYWTKAGENPAAKANEIIGKTGAYEEAQKLGADLRIPMERYATRLAPTEHNAAFVDEAKFRPDQLNQREVKELEKAMKEEASKPTPNLTIDELAKQTGISPVSLKQIAQVWAVGQPLAAFPVWENIAARNSSREIGIPSSWMTVQESGSLLPPGNQAAQYGTTPEPIVAQRGVTEIESSSSDLISSQSKNWQSGPNSGTSADTAISTPPSTNRYDEIIAEENIKSEVRNSAWWTGAQKPFAFDQSTLTHLTTNLADARKADKQAKHLVDNLKQKNDDVAPALIGEHIAVLKNAVSDVIRSGVPRTLFMKVTGVGVYQGYQGGQAFYSPTTRHVSVPAEVLNGAANDTATRIDHLALRRFLIHEGTHSLDDIGNMRTRTSTSPLFQFDIKKKWFRSITEQGAPEVIDITDEAKQGKIGGLIGEALFAWRDGFLRSAPTTSDLYKTGNFFRYPFDLLARWKLETTTEGKSDFIRMFQREVFAQMGALFYTYPQIMQRVMPKAYAFMEGIHGALQSRSNSVADLDSAIREAFQTPGPDVDSQVYGYGPADKNYQRRVAGGYATGGVEGTIEKGILRRNLGVNFEFYSPNLEEHIDFGVAKKNLDSENQGRFRVVTDEIDEKLGVASVSTSAVGDWVDGAENSIVSLSYGTPPAQLSYSAALKGLFGNQKSVLTFHEGEGNDAVWIIDTELDMKAARSKLGESGIAHRTLVETPTGTRVYIADIGATNTRAIEGFIHEQEAEFQFYAGTAEFIGADTRAEASRAYLARISQYERENPRHDQIVPRPRTLSVADHRSGANPQEVYAVAEQPLPVDRAFWAAVSKQVFSNPFSEEEVIFGTEDQKTLGGVQMSPWHTSTDGSWHISTVRAITKNGGRYAMEQLIKLADQHGVTLDLSAIPFKADAHALSKAKLIKWYKSFGFEQNPVYGAKDALIRHPNGVKAESYATGGYNVLATDVPQIRVGEQDSISLRSLESASLPAYVSALNNVYIRMVQRIVSNLESKKALNEQGKKFINDWKSIDLAQFNASAEQYLKTGKIDLPAGIQMAYSRWMVGMYRTMQAQGINLQSDVTEAFEALSFSSEQMHKQMTASNMAAMFQSPVPEVVTPAQVQQLQTLQDKARAEAQQEVDQKILKESNRKQSREWQAHFDEERRAVEKEVLSSGAYRALRALRDGTNVEGELLKHKVKIDAQSVDSLYNTPENAGASAEIIRRLRGMVADGGEHPDALAERFGYATGRDLVQALLGVADTSSYIRQEAQKRTLAKYGEVTPKTVVDDMSRAIHGDARQELMVAELAILADKLGRPKLTTDMVKSQAVFTIMTKNVEDIRPVLYERAAAAAGKAAFDYAKQDKLDLAYNEKRKQMINTALYKQALMAVEQVGKVVDYMARFEKDATRAKLGKAGEDYLEFIDGITEKFEFRRVTGKELGRRKDLLDFIRRKQESGETMGEEIGVPDALMQEAERINYRSMRFDELIRLRDMVKQVYHLATLKNRLVSNQSAREFADAKTEMIASAEKFNKKKPPPPLSRSSETKIGKAKRGAREFDASMMKVERLIDWLDGNDIDGPWHRYLWNGVADAQTAEYDLTSEVTAKIAKAVISMPKEISQRQLEKIPAIDGLPVMNRREMMGVALNWGNYSNRAKLLKGMGWSQAQVDQVLANMTAGEWQFVQGVWDTLESLWPQIAALQQEITGLEPMRLERSPVRTPHGTFAGGYYPMIYNPAYSHIGEIQEARLSSDIGGLVEPAYTRATTPQGHTISRVEGYARPVSLDMELLPAHVAGVIKDLTHRKWMIDANRILSDKDIQRTLTERLGPEDKALFGEWLRRNVNSRNFASLKTLDVWHRMFEAARYNTAIVAMGFKATTLLSQIAGIAPAIDIVGGRDLDGLKWMRGAFAEAIGRPLDLYHEVTTKSGEMRHRFETRDRDLRDKFRLLQGDSGKLAKVQELAMNSIGAMEMLVSLPTWKAAYNKALSQGRSEEVAIRAGDRAVRLSQGASSSKDLAAVMQRGDVMRLFTMFYTPFSALYGQLREIGHDFGKLSVRESMIAAHRLLYVVVMASIMGELMSGRPPDEEKDETWLTWFLRVVGTYPAAAIPILRDIVPSLTGKFGRDMSPVMDTMKGIAKPIKTTVGYLNDEKEFSDVFKDSASSAAYLFGVPIKQVEITGGYLYDLYEGNDEPQDVFEFLHDMLYRRPQQ